jgi:Transglutaminase-like superfamily
MVEDTELIERIVDHVDLSIRLGRPLVPVGCLTRGLTLYHFLAAAGVSVRLRFGLGLIDGDHQGHCWLEKDGTPIFEVTDPRRDFQVMFSIP